MKRLYILTSLLMLAVCAMAQPDWAKKASKSVFTLKTFAADGTLIASTNGFFVRDNGEAVSCFSPFKGASRAVVIDASGKEIPVALILGANETYDVVKFQVAKTKVQPLALAGKSAAKDETVWLLPYRETKRVPQGTVQKTETFNGNYAYYTLELTMPDNSVGTPLLNANGEVIGLMQQPNAVGDAKSFAVSALFADSLKVNGLSINDPVLRSTQIKKALPDDLNQAQLTLYMGGSLQDSLAYVTLIEDFIAKFPKEPDGYTYRAQMLADGHHFAEADRDMQKALKVAEKPDEVHYSYSRLILQKMVYSTDTLYKAWTFDRAFDEAAEAYRLNAQPTYRQQQAFVRYVQQNYAEAYDIYESLFQSSLRSADLFYSASLCKQQLKDSTSQLALLDSCVAQFSRPYLKEVAPYLLSRAQLLMDLGRHRQAVSDLNDYEEVMKAQVNSNFYYMRFRVETEGRLFQQALNDIEKAITMTPQSDLYYAEKASLQIRVGLYDEAVETAKTCIQLAPEHSDGYLFLGLAQCLKDQKAEGVKNLQKAKELGDAQADELIEKYSK
ncbi:tetratricopeptide repeat-containing serine protease family protein [Prevotella sp. E15-22]|uniref:tetratricopeptide repeat-containing S1 family peptidase n=1 Tax=Prevotella sp. E15-22 TaxID=2937774 RepID=UPI00206D86B6|nr:tetratricopeptide repeat-containing serine protease family protein [Prevotella sp. E15-22]UPS43650.1 tetratricopeptide repeat-containing serine protease family protein [Prevotella sp. E15-22]